MSDLAFAFILIALLWQLISRQVVADVIGTDRVGVSVIYWVDRGTDKIQRANLDGSNIQDLVTRPTLNNPVDIALDISGGKMYWVDETTDKIQRANLDGSNIQDLITTGLDLPTGIALDISSGKMYWVDRGTDKIQRANLDGSNIQDLVTTELATPSGIALDIVGGKMYWVDRGTDKIQRANLDGSNIQDLITGLPGAWDIALDIAGGKMYWVDDSVDKIQRAGLDGSNIEDLITTGLTDPSSIALDIAGGKMYWVDRGTDKIQRANLDGSNIEDLITTGLTTPVSIYLNAPTATDIIASSPDFDGDGIVGISDFLLWIRAYYSYREDQDQYEVKYDLSSDGTIDQDDFVIFVNSFGKVVNRAPVFMSRTYVTYFIDENTPGGTAIGDPISVTDADGDILTYHLSGKDADHFAIDARMGQIRAKEGITYDYEYRTTYSVIVEVNDRQGGTARILVIIKINDLKEPPSSPPSNFQVFPGNESLTVHYHAVPDEPGRPPVRGYHAEIRRGENGPWGTHKIIYGRTNTTVYYHKIDPYRYQSRILVNGQLYQVRVRTWNSDGASDWSVPVSGTPVYVPQKVKSELAQFQGEKDMASVEIDLSRFTGEGGKVRIASTTLPANIPQEDVKGIFVEIVEVKVSNASAVPPDKGFTISGSSSLFDIDLKAQVNRRNINIGGALRGPVEICLPVPENISKPVLIYYDKSRRVWEMLADQRVDGNVVCAFTDRFSLFGVGSKVNLITATGTISAQVLTVGTSGMVDVSSYFSDPDGGQLTYSALSSDTDIATVSVMGSVLTISPVSAGSAMITVTVSDGSTSVEQTFNVKVMAATLDNSAPVAEYKMYWTDRGTDKIQRSDLDGSNIQDLVTRPTLSNPVDIALDISGGKMYWVDEGTDKIQRSNLDGSNIQDLLTTGLDLPTGIALDISGGKMYWSDRGTDKIQRADLDGNNVEDLVTGLSAPSGIALDVSGGKMYWVDDGTNKIQRANLDGSSVEDLITTGLTTPVDLSLDVSGGKMYWTDRGAGKIQRAGLDGSSVEDLVTSVTDPRGIALNISSGLNISDGKMYWVDNSTDKIQRANLDGSSVEDVLTTGLQTPVSIVLDVLSAQVLTVGTSGMVDVSGYFSDPEGDQLTYSALSSDTDIATVSVVGSVLTISPVSEGSAMVTVTVNDGHSSIEQTFTVTVNAPPNNAPVFSSSATFNVAENSTAVGTVVADDADSEDSITGYTLIGGVDQDKFEITNGGVLSFKTAPNFEAPTDVLSTTPSNAASNNEYIVAVRATSGTGARVTTATQTLTITVTDVDTEAPGSPAAPVVSSSTLNSLAVTWNAPANTGPAISAYDVRYILTSADETDDANWTEVLNVWTSGALAYTLSGLTQNTSYDIQVRAKSDEGTSDWSVSVSGTTSANSAPVAEGKMYWVDRGTDKIQRSDLDGASVEDLVMRPTLSNPVDIALDLSGGKMYWVDEGTDKIQRSNLDGSNIEDLITTGLDLPTGIALDISSGKIYWSDRGTDKVQRSDLDGSNVEDLVTGLSAPSGIALDISGGKMYWVDDGTNKIQRADIELGQGETTRTVEDLVTTGLTTPVDLSLDVSGGKMYWTDRGTGKIQRSDLDGNTVEDLITGVTEPRGIALDVSGGKMYWVDNSTDKIQRANLDGSGVEDLITTGLTTPVSIVLDVLSAQILTVGTSGMVDVSSYFSDPEGDQLTYSALSSDTDIATVSVVGSVLTISPVSAGSAMVTVTVNDGSVSVQKTFDVIVVDPPNNAPVFSSSATFNVAENSTAVGTVVADDADSEDSITGYTLTGGVDQGKFEITNGGVLSFKTAPNFEAPTDVLSTTPSNAASNNEYIVAVRATSGTGARVTTATQTLTITVTDVDTEAPGSPAAPVVSSSTLNSLAVTWNAPANTGPAISAYDVRYILTSADETDDANWTEVLNVWTSGALAYTLSGLTQNTSYDIQVRAKNAEGTGDWSVSVSGTTSANSAPVAEGKMYWMDRGTDKVQRSDLDGSNIEDLVMSPTLGAPVDMALDVSGGKMYWVDENTDKIQRSDLNGSNIQDLLTTGLDSPTGIALDLSGGKMYWTDRGTDKIQRADLDGSNVEDLVTGLSAPSGIALDISSGKMYWVDNGADKIQRADLDGSNVEDLVAGVTDPRGIALDVSGGKMYWVDNGADKIQRSDLDGSNLDGSNIEDLVTGVTEPRGIALDVSGGKMYWVDNGADKIQRANLDGSNVEDLVTTGLQTPVSIVLDVLSAQILTVGTSGMVDVSGYFSDPEGDQLTYSALSSDMDIATVSVVGSVLTISPVSEGSAMVTVTVSDGSASVQKTFDVTVVDPPNNAPVFSSSATFNVAENSTAVGTVVADDADSEDSITGYTLIGGVDQGEFEITNGGVLSFTTAPDFEVPTDVLSTTPSNAASNNEYIVEVRAMSGTGARVATATQTLTVTVTDVDTEAPGIPAAPVVSASTLNSLAVTWSAPANTGPAISAYDVRYILTSADETDDANWTEVLNVWTSGALAYTFSGLTQNTSYDIQVRAKSDEGTSGWSDSVTGTTQTPANSTPVVEGKMYWTDRGTDKIQRSDLDGSNIKDLVMRPTLSNPVDIALDISGGKMYWVDETKDKIQRSDLDGSNIQDLITTGLDLPTGIALDVSSGKMYWVDRGTDKIQRSDLDGSSVEDLVTGLSAPSGIALDLSGGKMYWVDDGTNKIQRADIELGQGETTRTVEDLVTTGLTTPVDLSLDVSGGKMYWTDRGAGKIQRSNLDGSSVEDLVTSVTDPRGIVLDVSGGKMYWVDNGADKIQRANLDGSNVEDLITTGLTTPVSIVLDVLSAQVLTIGTDGEVDVSGYFSDPDGDQLTYSALSSDTDIATVSVVGSVLTISPVSGGSAMVTVTVNDGSASVQKTFDVKVNSAPVAEGKMYWTDRGTDKIQRSDLDGNTVEDLVMRPTLSNPVDIALDVSGGKMYWIDEGTDKVQRSDLDGSNIEDLITTGLDLPTGIALDVSGGKIYWSDRGTDKIQRADIELGQGETTRTVEDLVTGLSAPSGIALDVSGGKMYWVDDGTNKIQRADIELGQGETTRTVEDLVTTGLTTPVDLSLDISGGKMYWTDRGADKIQRSNLDGSSVEDLVTSVTDPRGIALDVSGGKMYWVDNSTDKIQRANLDGSSVEDVLTTGLQTPVSIVLDVK